MIRMQPNLIARLKAAKTQADLYDLVQAAIQLEHSTIPPYLTALYSIQPGRNQVTAEILASIVREEMLHMTIASNLLIAIGGKPNFSAQGFVPSYPGPLPMQVDDGMDVGLEPCSKDLIYKTFMRIEQPPSGTYPTIGDFYETLLSRLDDMSVTWGPAEAQVTPTTSGTTWFRETDWFPITSLESAAASIKVIVSEGEGATDSPVDDDGDPAHFYRFGQVFYGAALMQNAERTWSYTGPDIIFDEVAVFPMTANAKAAMYPEGTRSRLLVDQFNQAYMQILLSLDRVFGGEPRRLNEVLGLMFQLRILAYEVLSQPDPSDDKKSTGLTFEYMGMISS